MLPLTWIIRAYSHITFGPCLLVFYSKMTDVGDMLAFSFKAFSVEADLAKGLLEYHPDNEEMQQDVTDREDDHDDIDKARNKDGSKLGSSDMMAMKSLEKTIAPTDMLSISMSGLARPLKSRVLQVVATLARRPDEDDADSDDDGMLHDDFEEEGTIVRSRITHLYEICGLLLFYKSAMEKGIGRLEKSSTTSTGDDDGGVDDHEAEKDVNPLIASLVDCLIETTSGYEATTRAYGAMFTQLSSVTGITEASQAQSMLSVISEVRLTSPGFSNDVNCPPQCQTILSIEWVAETLTEAALGQCSSLDDMLALRESIQAAEEAGLSSHAAVKLDKSIGEKESELVGALVEKETKKVLELCGLASVAEAWRLWQHQDVPSGETDSERIAMAAFPGLSQGSVEEGIKDFYASLYSPPLPSLDTQVKDPLLRKKARSKIAADIGELYGKLHANISSSTHGGYEDISFLIHTPEQVNTLFSA